MWTRRRRCFRVSISQDDGEIVIPKVPSSRPLSVSKPPRPREAETSEGQNHHHAIGPFDDDCHSCVPEVRLWHRVRGLLLAPLHKVRECQVTGLGAG
ncbi:hypothetical protein IG631_14709 [Alternaria alternata]|nr:hypothetical protein IG631_14709 [Alternaria alternata]